jgi:hypothetical protein
MSAPNYQTFVRGKMERSLATGLADVPPIHDGLFEFQKVLVAWALRRGRAAIFADTGLGKTRMQLEWARHVGDVLILAPLAVAAQTAAEGRRIGMDVAVCREATDVRPGVNITNYDRLHKFDVAGFRGVVLDESSIIKHHDAKTLGIMLDAFAATPFKLCATATPSPNDYTELGTHAEFLGVCSRAEMLSEFFVHDGGETQAWRLKGHARAEFWRWVASWAALLRRPSDLGFDDGGYDLPPLDVKHVTVGASYDDANAAGLLFPVEARTLQERRIARRGSVSSRVSAVADVVNADREPWIVWCDLNVESEALTRSIADAVEIRGAHDVEYKESVLADFAAGRTRVLVSKPSICGFGLNWQHCARMAFVGVTDSWESYYQAVRRCYRFGQQRAVEVHVFASELEGNVIRNLQRKEADAKSMAEELSVWTRDAVLASVTGLVRASNPYKPKGAIQVPDWMT